MEKMKVSYLDMHGELVKILPPCAGESTPVAVIVASDGRFDCVSVGLLRSQQSEVPRLQTLEQCLSCRYYTNSPQSPHCSHCTVRPTNWVSKSD